MKIIVTHASPDWDAIGSVWLVKKFLPNWQHADVEFVPAGQKSPKRAKIGPEIEKAIEETDDLEIIHVDTGMGPLDHHQTSDRNVCGTSRTWEFVKKQRSKGKSQNEESERMLMQDAAIDRIVKIIVQLDHFQEAFWENPTADYHEFSLNGVLDGLKLYKPNEDDYYVSFGISCLEMLVHEFENRIWAEKEIAENGVAFETKWGKAIGFETLNDSVIKLSQKMGYKIVLRKDPRKGYVRIKARPEKVEDKFENEGIDLTPIYEKLKGLDTKATWYLHVSKKMLLNGTPKNPKMIPTTLSLSEIIEVIKSS